MSTPLSTGTPPIAPTMSTPPSTATPPTATNAPAPRPVEIVAFEGVQLLDVAGPLQVLTSCNDLLGERGEPPAYAAEVVSGAGGGVCSSAGLEIVTARFFGRSRSIDTLIVAGGFGVHEAALDGQLVRRIATRSRRARRTASVCTGAFLLAAAGRLDGRCATTHWDHAERLARCFPAVRVDAEPIYVEDGDVWTSAGVTAGIDMTLALVERDVGRELALAVARRLVVYLKRPGGQRQFSAALASQRSARFAALHDWMRARPAADLSVAALAAHVHMSERTFARAFAADTGTTPAKAVEAVRVETARTALEGDGALKRVARDCGFGSVETMRRAFLRTVGVGPDEYRRRFARAEDDE